MLDDDDDDQIARTCHGYRIGQGRVGRDPGNDRYFMKYHLKQL